MDVPIDRRTLVRTGAAAGLAASSGLLAAAPQGSGTAPSTPPGTMELAYAANAPTTPTGLAIDAQGRALLFMPRFDVQTRFSIGLVGADGSVTPWPDAAINQPDVRRPRETLFHIPTACSTRASGGECSMRG